MVHFSACCSTETPGGKWTWYRRFFSSGTSSNLEVLYHRLLEGQTCSSFFPLVQQLVLSTFFSYFLSYTPDYIFRTSEPKTNVTCRFFSALYQTGACTVIKNQEFGASLCHWQLLQNYGCLEKAYKKNIVRPFCYSFRKQEKETHEAVDRALQVGIKSGQDRICGWLLVICGKEEKY